MGKNPKPKRSVVDRVEAVVLSVVNGVMNLLAKFGLPGIFLAFLMYYATDEQRNEFIEKIILLKNVGKWWVAILIFGTIAVTLGQRYYYERAKEELERENKALRKELRKLRAKVLKTMKKRGP
jgi:hypothetical protein